MNVEVEIYVSNIIKFFKDNPSDLETLVPRVMENEFYDKVREMSYKNLENGVDVVLTQEQIIRIVTELKVGMEFEKYHQMTNVGLIHLN
jgi:uncharacterized protein with von Willebrand factor type A (vWA) domain